MAKRATKGRNGAGASEPPRYFSPVPLDTPQQWTEQALYLYGLFYNMEVSYTPAERRMLGERQAELKAQMPEQYKSGIHVLGPRAAYLGENVLVVDGRLDHPFHMDCPSCRTWGLVRRDERLFPARPPVSLIWCVVCNKFTQDMG